MREMAFRKGKRIDGRALDEVDAFRKNRVHGHKANFERSWCLRYKCVKMQKQIHGRIQILRIYTINPISIFIIV